MHSFQRNAIQYVSLEKSKGRPPLGRCFLKDLAHVDQAVVLARRRRHSKPTEAFVQDIVAVPIGNANHDHLMNHPDGRSPCHIFRDSGTVDGIGKEFPRGGHFLGVLLGNPVQMPTPHQGIFAAMNAFSIDENVIAGKACCGRQVFQFLLTEFLLCLWMLWLLLMQWFCVGIQAIRRTSSSSSSVLGRSRSFPSDNVRGIVPDCNSSFVDRGGRSIGRGIGGVFTVATRSLPHLVQNGILVREGPTKRPSLSNSLEHVIVLYYCDGNGYVVGSLLVTLWGGLSSSLSTKRFFFVYFPVGVGQTIESKSRCVQSGKVLLIK